MMAVEEMAIWCAMLLPSCSHRLTKWIVLELLSATIFAFLFLGAHHFWVGSDIVFGGFAGLSSKVLEATCYCADTPRGLPLHMKH
jgi:uncharacterized membrane-anchored protein YitT (DUF2179 family)